MGSLAGMPKTDFLFLFRIAFVFNYRLVDNKHLSMKPIKLAGKLTSQRGRKASLKTYGKPVLVSRGGKNLT